MTFTPVGWVVIDQRGNRQFVQDEAAAALRAVQFRGRYVEVYIIDEVEEPDARPGPSAPGN